MISQSDEANAAYDERFEQVGNDPAHQRRATPEEEKAINDALGLEPVRLNMDKELYAFYEDLGKKLGIITIAAIREALKDYKTILEGNE